MFDGCSVDRCLDGFGGPGDLPVTGDWTGTGRTAIGIFRPSDRTWILDLNDNGRFDECSVDRCVPTFGAVGDLPITGAW